jgi:hypothetical protein
LKANGDVDLVVDTEERKEAVAKDPHMRLMLKLLSFEREEAEIGQPFVPSSISNTLTYRNSRSVEMVSTCFHPSLES